MSEMQDRIREAIDTGGGQTCDIEGVIRELGKAGFVIVPREPTEAMIGGAEKCDFLWWSSEPGEGLDGIDHEEHWHAMIDEALK